MKTLVAVAKAAVSAGNPGLSVLGRRLLACLLVALGMLEFSGGPAASDVPALPDRQVEQEFAAEMQRTTLRGGWTPSAPYQMESPDTVGGLAGIDVEITEEVARRAGFGVHFDLESWETQLARLSSGEADFASGAVVPADADEISGSYFVGPSEAGAAVRVTIKTSSAPREATCFVT